VLFLSNLVLAWVVFWVLSASARRLRAQEEGEAHDHDLHDHDASGPEGHAELAPVAAHPAAAH
jgi:hypothetical protein